MYRVSVQTLSECNKTKTKTKNERTKKQINAIDDLVCSLEAVNIETVLIYKYRNSI